MKCQYCNKQISDNIQFCPYCGQSVGTVKSNSSVDKYWNEVNKEDVKRSVQYGAVMDEKDKIARTRRTKTIVTVVLVSAFLLAGTIFFINLKSDSNAKLEQVKELLPNNTYTCFYSDTDLGFNIHYYNYKLVFSENTADYYYFETIGPPDDDEDYKLIGSFSYNVNRSIFGKYTITVNNRTFTLKVDEDNAPKYISYGE